MWTKAVSRHPELTSDPERLALEGYGGSAKRRAFGTQLNVEASDALPRGFDAPWVPVRAAVASIPGEGGWIPVPLWDATVHPRFC